VRNFARDAPPLHCVLRATKFEFEKRFWIICATAVFTPARSTAHTAAIWLRR